MIKLKIVMYNSIEMIYYYVLISNPDEIFSTDILNEYINLLYENKAIFISDGQRRTLGLSKTYFQDLKREISMNKEKIPLYDIRTDHVFLIYWQNVYPRIYYEDYRFVSQLFYDHLRNLENPSENEKENLRILSFYDIEILYHTYMNVFYDSFIVNSYVTNCVRPSFNLNLEHISPYYSINELNFFAYDWKLTKQVTIDKDDLNKLCVKVSNLDISSKTLINHQMHIFNSKAIGLVKYYSLYGSYYMNYYLRNASSNASYIRKLNLENQIIAMIKLIKKAPKFEKSHIVYRFVEKDDYLKHLKIGEIYQDPSFMSTTRNPFYYKENYSFGLTLIKIKIPENTVGIGLCIESYSNFSKEEEIILPPTSKYKLLNITDERDKKHEKFHDAFSLKVQKKYEFLLLGNDYLNVDDDVVKLHIPITNAHTPEIKTVNFQELLNDEHLINLKMVDKLDYFRKNYAVNNQFESIISGIKYTFNIESYDSSSIYRLFFYYERKDGIMITTANPKYGNINLLIELGPEIHVNYYFRYSVTDPSVVVDLNKPEWMEWISLFTYVVGSRTAVIHSNYTLQYKKSDSIQEKIMKTKYTYSENIYCYMKFKKKFFEFLEVTTQFDYSQFDYLTYISVDDIIKPTDRNELFTIAKTSGKKNMYDFYIYVVENYPKLVETIEEKMNLIYDDPNNNPFLNIKYNLNSWQYLYEKGFIRQLPSEKDVLTKTGSFKKLIGDKKIPKFKNRLRYHFNI